MGTFDQDRKIFGHGYHPVFMTFGIIYDHRVIALINFTDSKVDCFVSSQTGRKKKTEKYFISNSHPLNSRRLTFGNEAFDDTENAPHFHSQFVADV